MTSSKTQNKNQEISSYLEYLRGLNQDGPRLGNVFLEDTALIEYTQPILRGKTQFLKELQRLGDSFNSKYLVAAKNAQNNHPRLQQFDSYGRRIDTLHLSEGWKNIAMYSAEDGIVALAYEEDRFGLKDMQRYGQMVALTMYQSSSGLYGCPLAMTDGAAYTIRQIFKNDKSSNSSSQILKGAYQRLTSRDPQKNWTSGQWMTEKKGGSDVSNTETVAIKQADGSYRLYGYKWFTSATDSQMSLALGKILPEGTSLTPENVSKLPLSLFFVQMRDQEGNLNNMEIIRLKDKLGTRQLPTAELLLKGAKALLISEPGRGVKYISNMLTVTRLYNAATAVSAIRRMLALSRDYSQRRIVGKQLLSNLPLHLRVLSDMEITYRGNLIFFLKTAELFSRQQAGTINQRDSNILRMMTPVLKLYTAKQCMSVMTEGLESFGGLGYIEGTQLPQVMRDAQVLSIWEGTTNVLCWDFVRALVKSDKNGPSPIDSFVRFVVEILELFQQPYHIFKAYSYCYDCRRCDLKNKTASETIAELTLTYNELIKDIKQLEASGFKTGHGRLRELSFGIARIYIGFLLCEFMLRYPTDQNVDIFRRWVQNEPLYSKTKNTEDMDRKLALDIGVDNQPRHSGNLDRRNIPRPRF